ncbi:hypothetical protein EGW08_009677 [Elysia chlorotica]|uniref:Uncharacterized protein n=1 Tax=Elysia chlorotica TaxID=188477 RepID=A0A3S0ZMK6_ELYCH|nr:hypothetical protein EGW08_009677 [Elysia chlorotica]
MSSNSTKLRNRWKKVNPEKYQQYLDHQRVKSKERRAEKKKRWESEPHSIDVILQKAREREQTRIRKRRLDDKRRLEAGLPLPNRSNTNQETKKPKDMTPDERRAYYAAQRQLSRARQDPEKKELSRVKCAEYQRRYRERIKLGVQQELPSAENNPSIPTPQTPPSHSHSPSSHNENPSLAVAPAALDADLPCPSQQSQRDTQTTFQHPTKKLVDLNSLLDSVLKNYTENVTEVTQIPELQVDIHPVIDCLPTQENTPKRRRAPSLLQSQTFCDVQVENSDEEFCVRLDLTHYQRM